MTSRRLRCRLWCSAALLILLMSPWRAEAADKIKLKNGTEFSGTVLGKDGNSVVIQLSRDDVGAVNGQPLPDLPTTGTAAPAFEAVDLSGAAHTLASEKGQVLLLSFWASWCPHCRADVPLLKDLFTRYQNQGFQVLAVSVDQDVTKLQNFVHKEQLPYPVVAAYDRSASPKQAAIPETYGAEGIPTYFLIDTHGKIVQNLSGSVTEGRVDLEGTIKRFLATP